MAEPGNPETFAYQAQSPGGEAYAGTIDAAGIDRAAEQLDSLHLLVTRLEPAEKKPAPAGPFRAADFLAFNQQLAALTAGGLPIERSLRLVAREVTGRRHAAAIGRVAERLEKGLPLAAAFEAEQGSFPPLYARLVDAGVRSNNLPAMLLNLGRHVQTRQRLRAAWWRAASYPLMVLSSLLVVMAFIWTCVMPKFSPLAAGPVFKPVTSKYGPGGWNMPTGANGIDPTVRFTLTFANGVGYTVMGAIALLLIGVAVLCVLGRTSKGQAAAERAVLPLPLIGPILRWNLIARWCDALQLGVTGGMPLPAALALARDAVPSPRLQADTAVLIDTVNAGRSLEMESTTTFIPPMVRASLQMGIEKNDLPAAAAMLARMYQEQAEIRVAVLPRVLSPLLLMLTATCIGLAVLAMLMPLVQMLRILTP